MKVQSPRTAAATRGEPKFSTGKPCKHGHISERDTKSGACIECRRALTRAHQAKISKLLKAASK